MLFRLAISVIFVVDIVFGAVPAALFCSEQNVTGYDYYCDSTDTTGFTSCLPGTFTNTSLVVNGDFEINSCTSAANYCSYPTGSTAIPGWEVLANGVFLVNKAYSPIYAHTGSWSTSWYAPGGVQQTINTVVGTAYKITFWSTGFCADNTNYITVSATGNAAQTFTTPDQRYAELEYFFEATGSSTVISFSSPSFSCVGANEIVLDTISIEAYNGQSFRTACPSGTYCACPSGSACPSTFGSPCRTITTSSGPMTPAQAFCNAHVPSITSQTYICNADGTGFCQCEPDGFSSQDACQACAPGTSCTCGAGNVCTTPCS